MKLTIHFHPEIKNAWSCTSNSLEVLIMLCLIRHKNNIAFLSLLLDPYKKYPYLGVEDLLFGELCIARRAECRNKSLKTGQLIGMKLSTFRYSSFSPNALFHWPVICLRIICKQIKFLCGQISSICIPNPHIRTYVCMYVCIPLPDIP